MENFAELPRDPIFYFFIFHDLRPYFSFFDSFRNFYIFVMRTLSEFFFWCPFCLAPFKTGNYY